MTETEKLLLSALERLQDDYETRQQAWQASYDSLQTMFTTTSAALMRSDQACQRLRRAGGELAAASHEA